MPVKEYADALLVMACAANETEVGVCLRYKNSDVSVVLMNTTFFQVK